MHGCLTVAAGPPRVLTRACSACLGLSSLVSRRAVFCRQDTGALFLAEALRPPPGYPRQALGGEGSAARYRNAAAAETAVAVEIGAADLVQCSPSPVSSRQYAVSQPPPGPETPAAQNDARASRDKGGCSYRRDGDAVAAFPAVSEPACSFGGPRRGCGLKWLGLADNGIGECGGAALAAALQERRGATRINVSDNQVGQDVLRILGEMRAA